MQGVIKSYDPGTGDGVIIADTDLIEYDLAPGALHGSVFRMLRQGQRVVFTTDDSAYAAAVDLSDAGVEVRAIVDARPEAPGEWLSACASRGIPVRTRQVVTGTDGVERVTAALVAPLDAGVPGEPERVDCDLLLVSGGWNPAVHLFSHVLNAQAIWIARITGTRSPVKVFQYHELDALRRLHEQTCPKLVELVQQADEAELARIIEYTNTQGKAYATPVGEILTHCFNHATYHRAQVALAIRGASLEPVNTDYITWVREMMGQE